ncbi:CocE/NonD family hydrolase [Novosphingobium sp. FSY-8]|uniref:CocE/NonD family hydrolase n=2 Tax=Novosphingobium ovatum TaxID=1908523 RepID=A0ABW9XC92_9SPHN|nr:CocE/NonD family hydrolase [Novosphingobium ovatum]
MGAALPAVAGALYAGLPVAAQPVTVQAQTAPAADYPDFVRSSLYVPVSDGTRLAVNIYRPARGTAAETARLPVIFAFTPYRARVRDAEGKVTEVALGDRLALRSLIRAGYVVAVADIRGKGASFGTRIGFQSRREAMDGHDLIEWLARQDFATGKVGMIGCSYLGGTTFQTATTAPPSLKAVFVGASDLDKYSFVRRGGISAQFNTRPDEPLSDDLASVPVDVDADGALLRQAVAQHEKNTPMAGLWYGMPYRDSISAYTGNAFWEEVGVYNHLNAIRKSGMATYFWSNWQDEPTAQSILSAANLAGSKFLAGPGGHCNPPPGFDFTGEVRRYFDHYLKGADNGINREPRATYWRERLPGGTVSAPGGFTGGYVRSNVLPGAGARATPWYLGGGHSGTARSVNDGMLLAAPAKGAGRDTFTVRYDLPASDYFAFWIKPMDDKGLSYTTAPLTRPMTLAGYPVARLRVSVDKPDANVFAYLDEVAPDGTAEVVSFGRLALSHRKLAAAPYATMGLPFHSGRKGDTLAMKPGVPADIAFDLTPVSRVVPVGYRLRLTITGADPRQRNLKEIEIKPAPVITLSRGAASRVDLPVVR